MASPHHTPSQRRFAVQYGLSLFVMLALIAGGIRLIQELPKLREHEARLVAYAATATHIAVPSPTVAFVPTATPAPTLPEPSPVLIPTSEDLFFLPTPTLDYTPIPDAPPRATPFPYDPAYNLINILVLGSDRRGDVGAYRTDAILVVSINQTAQTVNLLSIPRDLYVFIPGWGMDRVNTAELHQTQIGASSHPLGLLAETIEYNLGIHIDHLARIDFARFEQLIDTVGGVTVPVDCPVSGYQLADGVWVPFVLQPGVHRLNGELALWYVRQRMDSSDFDRNRRQQIVLRALWQAVRESDLLANLPLFWDQMTQIVETDVSLDTMLGLVPLALNLSPAKIESHFLGLDEVNLWHTPSGASVLVMDPAPLIETLRRFFSPPTQNQLVQEQARVQVLNGGSLDQADYLAAARLQWYGLVAIPAGVSGTPAERTTIYDFTGRVKGSSLGLLQRLLGVADADVVLVDDSTREVDFTVVIGNDYVSCVTDPWRAFVQSD